MNTEEYIKRFCFTLDNEWLKGFDVSLLPETIGVTDMELYLDGYQAFLLMDSMPYFDMDKDGERWANLPREKEWQKYVAKFQKVDPESNAAEKWKSMIQIGWK